MYIRAFQNIIYDWSDGYLIREVEREREYIAKKKYTQGSK